MAFYLFHYSSLASLSKIIESKLFRLYDITKSNDSKELTYMLPTLEKTFLAAYAAAKKQAAYFNRNVQENDFCSALDQFLSKLKPGSFTCFAICFSAKPDLLSQWRGYADDGKGVSLGFKYDTLNTETSRCLRLEKVIYNKNTQRALAREISDKVCSEIKTSSKKAPLYTADILTIMCNHLKDCQCLLACCKSPFFKEENEYRLFHLNYTSPLYDLGQGNCKKYIEFPIPTSDLSIVLGPKCNASTQDIEDYLKSKKFTNISVKKSNGTYQ